MKKTIIKHSVLMLCAFSFVLILKTDGIFVANKQIVLTLSIGAVFLFWTANNGLNLMKNAAISWFYLLWTVAKSNTKRVQ
jgi:hypothetical protein